MLVINAGVVPTPAFDAEYDLRGASGVESNLAQAFDVRGKWDTVNSATKQRNVEVDIGYVVHHVLKSGRPIWKMIAVSADGVDWTVGNQFLESR